MSDSFSAIILAGGRSFRMGKPKAALRFGSATILDRIAAELHRKFSEIIVVASPDDRIEIAGVRTIHDAVAFEGPVAALERGLRTAANDTVFACSCDLPLLGAAVAMELCRRLDDAAAVIPEVDGKLQPLHAAYHRTQAASGLSDMIARGEKRLTEIVAFMNARVIREAELREIDPELRSFLNVNTPEDYQRALELAGESPRK